MKMLQGIFFGIGLGLIFAVVVIDPVVSFPQLDSINWNCIVGRSGRSFTLRISVKNKRGNIMNWEDFVKKCDEVKPGSAEKLERIRKNKEAGFTENVLDREHPMDVLLGLFDWKETKEGKSFFKYWIDLCNKLSCC